MEDTEASVVPEVMALWLHWRQTFGYAYLMSKKTNGRVLDRLLKEGKFVAE